MFSRESFTVAVNAIRERNPLVHNITNYVAMNPSANALLAIGATPLMSFEKEEMAEISSISSSLVMNIGCIERYMVDAMFTAAEQAQCNNIPWVLDPVGAGASSIRSNTAVDLIRSYSPSVIRANASEVLSLYGHNYLIAGGNNQEGCDSLGKGVDSTISSGEVIEQAKALARVTGSIVSVSGETDYITNGTSTISIENGSLFMPKITAMGCTASAITAAFLAVTAEGEALEAAASAMALMGTAGEMAHERTIASGGGTGTFQMHFLDVLSTVSAANLADRLKYSLL